MSTTDHTPIAPTARPASRQQETLRVAAARARTDVSAGDPAPPSGPGPVASVSAVSAVSAGAVRATGAALSVSAAAWSLLMMLSSGADSVLGAVVAIAFQCSMLALLALAWRTRATGAPTAGRVLLGVVAAILGLATVQSLSEAVPGALADTVSAVLDLTWPLSMLGMFVVGITIAAVGRWRGAARVWAPVATSWIAFLPVMMIAPEGVGGLVATGHILVGYVVLGAVLALRPDLPRAHAM